MGVLGGLDLSHHNGDVRYDQAYQQGAGFILHKATEGNFYTDPAFARRMPLIRASGALYGRYHFVSTTDPRGQVARALDVAGDPREHGDLVQFDWEPDGKQLASPAMAQAVLDEWLTQTDGYPAFIYYPHWVWQQQGSPRLGRTILSMPLWASHYLPPGNYGFGSVGQVPRSWWTPYAGWAQVDILQWTDSGRLAGVGDLDLNMFAGDRALLSTFTRSDDMTPDQADQLAAVHSMLRSLYVGSLDDPDNVSPRWWRRIVTGSFSPEYPQTGAGLETIAAAQLELVDQFQQLRAEVEQLRAALPEVSGGK